MLMWITNVRLVSIVLNGSGGSGLSCLSCLHLLSILYTSEPRYIQVLYYIGRVCRIRGDRHATLRTRTTGSTARSIDNSTTSISFFFASLLGPIWIHSLNLFSQPNQRHFWEPYTFLSDQESTSDTGLRQSFLGKLFYFYSLRNRI